MFCIFWQGKDYHKLNSFSLITNRQAEPTDFTRTSRLARGRIRREKASKLDQGAKTDFTKRDHLLRLSSLCPSALTIQVHDLRCDKQQHCEVTYVGLHARAHYYVRRRKTCWHSSNTKASQTDQKKTPKTPPHPKQAPWENSAYE